MDQDSKLPPVQPIPHSVGDTQSRNSLLQHNYKRALAEYSATRTTSLLSKYTKQGTLALKASLYLIGIGWAVRISFYLWYRLEYDINVMKPKASAYLKNRLS